MGACEALEGHVAFMSRTTQAAIFARREAQARARAAEARLEAAEARARRLEAAVQELKGDSALLRAELAAVRAAPRDPAGDARERERAQLQADLAAATEQIDRLYGHLDALCGKLGRPLGWGGGALGEAGAGAAATPEAARGALPHGESSDGSLHLTPSALEIDAV